jgi:hypothetical protein
MARDGVPVFFEWPGPTSREFQPPMADEKTRAMAKDKILKVIKRRYLLTMGINVKSLKVFYGFGDASGKQFGATLSQNYNCKAWLSKTRKDKRGIRFHIGLWSAAEEAKCSNYKDLKNLVDRVSEEAKAGRL